ncbi:hypothetical protein ACQR36_17880 [Rhodococcus erythropolis]|uniref:hypothetical protein n=1 Tax=Rhodococcus erythropolis TaxID=1833 RepID=UPI003D14F58A
MVTPARDLARIRYASEFPRFKAAAEASRSLLLNLIQNEGISDAFIKVRAKEISSFVKKSRKYGDDCWARTTDKVGAQVVVHTLAEVRQMRICLEASPAGLQHVETTEKSPYTGDPRALGYAGVHVQVSLTDSTTSDGEQIECEIQLRTQAQDVWSYLEHGLIYKPVIDPSQGIARKVARLSVLVEMFDEEVDTVMDELTSDPRYRNALLLREAERWFLTFATEPGDRDLSVEVLDQINASLDDLEVGLYRGKLAAFVDERRLQIEDALKDYGVGSDYEKEFTYFLFTQPEALIVWERLESKPLAIARAVKGTDLEAAVGALADVWGIPLPGTA